MRIMSLDYGDAKIGIAMTDPLCIIANGIESYKRQGEKKDIEYIATMIENSGVGTVVFGLPVNMDGSEGIRVEKTKEFAALLKDRCPLVKIDYQDERLTTVSAERALLEADMRRDKRKLVIDKIAATIILQTYLERRR